MVVFRKSFNFYLHLPIAYYSRDTVLDSPFMLDFLYDRSEADHYSNFPLIYSFDQYYSHVECVMRGFLVREALFELVDSWHYIQTQDKINANKLCTQLIRMKPYFSGLTDLLYGKKDSFLHNVPLETLHQFFEQYSFDEFVNLIKPYCEIVDANHFTEKKFSLISYVFSNEYLINRSIKANCIYLEDLLENATLCESILERLNKPELAYILNYFLHFINK